MAPSREPALGSPDDPDDDHGGDGQDREHLAGREEERADHAGSHLGANATVDHLVGIGLQRRPGVVGPDRLRARDDLGDRGEHLAVALAGLLVGR